MERGERRSTTHARNTTTMTMTTNDGRNEDATNGRARLDRVDFAALAQAVEAVLDDAVELGCAQLAQEARLPLVQLVSSEI